MFGRQLTMAEVGQHISVICKCQSLPFRVISRYRRAGDAYHYDMEGEYVTVELAPNDYIIRVIDEDGNECRGDSSHETIYSCRQLGARKFLTMLKNYMKQKDRYYENDKADYWR